MPVNSKRKRPEWRDLYIEDINKTFAKMLKYYDADQVAVRGDGVRHIYLYVKDDDVLEIMLYLKNKYGRNDIEQHRTRDEIVFKHAPAAGW